MKFNEILSLLKGADDEWLFKTAQKERIRIFGQDVFLRGIVEFSNVCTKHCQYCGLRPENHRLNRYRLSADDIMDAVALIPDLGLGTVVMQSGDDPYYSREMIGEVIKRIKSKFNMAVTLSLGERDKDDYQYWRDCGADRYLLKIETFETKLHAEIRPGESVDQRLRHIETLREIGYEIGSGIIVGLPGMNDETLARDMKKLTEMQLHMISAGPFVPNPETPLQNDEPGDLEIVYRTIAILRILNPYANIPSTSSIAVSKDDGAVRGLKAGANVMMPSALEYPGRFW